MPIKINRQNLYEYFKNVLDTDCYVLLHGIGDNSDLLNQYSNLPKEQKAQNILDIGLINDRKTTISLTARNFGNLEEASTDKIDKFNNYGFYSYLSGEEAIVVIAIPYFFETTNGERIFGGYKEYETDEFHEKAECITDYIFREHIPSEMVYGYYTYKDDSDTASFVENPKYYTKLSQDEKDEFINKYFESYDRLDVNNETIIEKVKSYSTISTIISHSAHENTLKQYNELLKKNQKIIGLTPPIIESNTNTDGDIKTGVDERIQQVQEILDDNDFGDTFKILKTLQTMKQENEMFSFVKRLDQFLSRQKHISDCSLAKFKNLLEKMSNDPEYVEWLNMQKIEMLKSSEEFKNFNYQIEDCEVPFEVQLENNSFKGETNSILDSLVALPIYSYIAKTKEDEDFRLKYFAKMALANGQYIVTEKEIKNSDLEAFKRSFFEALKKLQSSGSIDKKTYDMVFAQVANQFFKDMPISFEGAIFVNDWENYKSKQNVKIVDVNENGESNWNLEGFELYDNRPKEKTLENQLSTGEKYIKPSTKSNIETLTDAEISKKILLLMLENKKSRYNLIKISGNWIKTEERFTKVIKELVSAPTIPQSRNERIKLIEQLEQEKQNIQQEIEDVIDAVQSKGVTTSVADFEKAITELDQEEKNKGIKPNHRPLTVQIKREKDWEEEFEKLLDNYELRTQITVKNIDRGCALDIQDEINNITGAIMGYTINGRTESWQDNWELHRELIGYDFEELKNTNPREIDKKRLKNNFETVVESKLGIKEIMICEPSYDLNGIAEQSLAEKYGFDVSKYSCDKSNGYYGDYQQMISDFESQLSSMGLNVAQVYKESYDKHRHYYFSSFLDSLQRKRYDLLKRDEVLNSVHESLSKKHDDILIKNQNVATPTSEEISTTERTKNLSTLLNLCDPSQQLSSMLEESEVLTPEADAKKASV